MTNTPVTPEKKPIPQPIDQVFIENKDEFQKAGLTATSLSVQSPEGAKAAPQGTLESLPEEKRKAVQTAMAEGFFITVDGQTFSPTKEGIDRRGKREALTQAAQNGGREKLVEAGLWDDSTNTPSGLDRLHSATQDNAELSSSNEDDKKAEALLKGYRVEGNWWEKNKDWVVPLLLGLAGTALGFALAKCFDSNDQDGANAATQLLNKAMGNTNTNTNTNANENGNTNANSNANASTSNTQSAAKPTTQVQQATPTPPQTGTNPTLGASAQDITSGQQTQQTQHRVVPGTRITR